MRIVTLCGCGLGTCFILKFTAEKAAHELGIQAEVVPSGISSCNIEEADLYLAPFGLDTGSVGSNAPIETIRNVISTEEVKQAIQKLINAEQKGKG